MEYVCVTMCLSLANLIKEDFDLIFRTLASDTCVCPTIAQMQFPYYDIDCIRIPSCEFGQKAAITAIIDNVA